MDYSAHHQYQGYDSSAQSIHHHQAYDPSTQPFRRHQGYDPSAQTQQFYNPPREDYYSYAYSNPQYVNNNPYPYSYSYSYHAANVRPSQHQEQEPNPPGVTVLPPPQHDPNAYYRSLTTTAYTVGPQQGGVDVSHQPILQSSYNNTGIISGVAPLVGAQTHLGPTPNFSARPYRGRGGHGRGRGRSLHKHGPPPAQDQVIFTQAGPHVQVTPPQHGPSVVPTPMSIQGQARAAPPSKHLWCELCKVECNSVEIFNRHTSGKKHIKKLKSVGGQIGEAPIPISSEVPFQLEQLQQETLLPSSQDINEESKAAVGKVKVEEEVEEAKPLWCDLCKAHCNSVEILNKHLNGKKHLKNLNKSRIGVKTEQQTFASELKPEVPFQPKQESLPSQDNNEENKILAGKQQVEESEPIERGSKRKMRGGKVCRNKKPFGRSNKPVEPPQPNEVVVPLLCELCNITCESQVAFQNHLAGKKHLSNAKRFLNENKRLGQEVFQIMKHAFQTLQEQSANAPTSIMASQLQHHGLLAQPLDFQAPALESNFVGGISQPQLQAEGISNEGRLVSAEMEIVAADDKLVVVTSETT